MTNTDEIARDIAILHEANKLTAIPETMPDTLREAHLKKIIFHLVTKLQDIKNLASKELTDYQCPCSAKDIHGCSDCGNSGLILDNPTAGTVYEIYQVATKEINK